MEAYVLINSDPGMLWRIAEKALKIKGVKMAHAVTGQFDVVAYAEFINMKQFREIISEFQSLKGVQEIQTIIAIPPRIRH